MLKKTSLKELAYLSGFSVSTVSKALADSSEISEKTKVKIRALAKEYRYVPNASARNLKRMATKTVGVVVPDILSSFFSKVLNGIEQEITRKGYHLIICISNESIRKEKQSIAYFKTGSVDGFLISLSKETQLKEKFDHLTSVIDDGMPVVMFDRVSDRLNCDKVVINDFESSYQCTNNLLNSGCRHIVFVSPIFKTNVGLERAKGYENAINDFKKEGVSTTFLFFEDYKKFKKDFKKLITEVKVDAVLAADELSAVTAQNIILNNGFKVPEDISIIGFTNGLLAENSNPPLTTINQNEIEIGKTAARILIKRLEEDDAETKTTVIKSSIIFRGSSLLT